MRGWKNGLGVVALLAMLGVLPARAQTVMAAASMTDALNELSRAWVAQGHPAPTLVYGSSGALARQVAQGAPGDIFISASTTWARFLDKQGRVVDGSQISPLGNALVVIAPGAPEADAPTAPEVTKTSDLVTRLGAGRLAIGEPTSVPAGDYALQAFVKLGLWSALVPHVAPMPDVRGVVRLVATREAPYGVVYASDAAASKDVHVVGIFPEASHNPIVYPFALLKHDGTDPAAAKALFAWLTGPQAASVYRRYGFTVLH